MNRPAPAKPAAKGTLLIRIAVAVWVLLFLFVTLRSFVDPQPARNNVYLKVFAKAARAFADERELYPSHGADDFRYPPVAAAMLVPFERCGDRVGSALWRALNVVVLLLGLSAAFRRGFPFVHSRGERAVVLLVGAVAGLSSLNNGQANGLMLGLFLLATTAVLRSRDAAPGAAISFCTGLKIYPLAYGLVLSVLRPRLLPWLLLGAAFMGLLPFALRSPEWVVEQYRVLTQALLHEDRTALDLHRAYRDVRLMAGVIGVPVTKLVFLLLQVAGGALIPALCLLLRRGGAGPERVLATAFSLTMCWFLLLGPATEKATYILLGPVLGWGLVQAWRSPGFTARAVWVLALLLLIASEFEPNRRLQAELPWLRAPLPLSALLVTVALVARDVAELRSKAWRTGDAVAEPARARERDR